VGGKGAFRNGDAVGVGASRGGMASEIANEEAEYDCDVGYSSYYISQQAGYRKRRGERGLKSIALTHSRTHALTHSLTHSLTH